MEKKPEGFMVYTDHLTIMKGLNVEERWRVLMALQKYHECGARPEGESEFFMACFELMRGSIDRQMARYKRTCERNREIAQNRKSANAPVVPLVTSGTNQTKRNQTKPNETKVFDDLMKEVSFDDIYPSM